MFSMMKSIGLLSAVTLAGCATVPRGAGFGDVQKSVADRTGVLVQWRGNTAEDAAVDAHVRSMLERELTADAAVQVALLNNARLQATYQRLGIAQAELVQAGLLSNPTVGLEVRFPKAPHLPFEVDVAQAFVDLLSAPLRKHVAATRFEATKDEVAHEVVELAADVREAFYTVQAAQQAVEMWRTVVEATDASAFAAARLHAAGNFTDLDLANEQAQAAQARLDLAEAEAEVEQDRERLTTLMGLWGADTAWRVGDRLPELPPASDVPPRGLETLAIRQRLDIAAARRELASTAQELGLARAFLWLPELTVGGHYEREADGEQSAGPFVEVPIPLFDQGQATLAAGNARLAQARQAFAAQAVEVRSEVRAARAKLDAARRRAAYHRDVVLPLRSRVLDETRRHYNGMLVSVFDLLRAKQEQVDAGRAYIESLRDYWLARTALERAVGGRLPAAESAPTTRPATAPVPAPAVAPAHEHRH